MEFDTSGPQWKPKGSHPDMDHFADVHHMLQGFAEREHKSRHPDAYPVEASQTLKKPKNLSPTDDPQIRSIKNRAQLAMEARCHGGYIMSNGKRRHFSEYIPTRAELVYSQYIDPTSGGNSKISAAYYLNKEVFPRNRRNHQTNCIPIQSIPQSQDQGAVSFSTPNQLSSQLQSLQEQFKDLKISQGKTDEIANKNRVTLKKFSATGTSLLEEVDLLQGRMKKTEGRMEETDGRMEKAEGNIRELQRETARETNIPESAKLDIAKNKGHIADILTHLERLNGITSTQDQTIKELKEQLGNAKNKYDELAKKFEQVVKPNNGPAEKSDGVMKPNNALAKKFGGMTKQNNSSARQPAAKTTIPPPVTNRNATPVATKASLNQSKRKAASMAMQPATPTRSMTSSQEGTAQDRQAKTGTVKTSSARKTAPTEEVNEDHPSKKRKHNFDFE